MKQFYRAKRIKVFKGRYNKRIFPRMNDRQKLNINITPIFITMMTDHGKARAYLRRFKFQDKQTAPANTEIIP